MPTINPTAINMLNTAFTASLVQTWIPVFQDSPTLVNMLNAAIAIYPEYLVDQALPQALGTPVTMNNFGAVPVFRQALQQGVSPLPSIANYNLTANPEQPRRSRLNI